jgi:hypothetical protein
MKLHKFAAIFGGLALASSLSACSINIDLGGLRPSRPPSVEVSVPASEPPSTTGAADVLGPTGVGSLVLGMTKAEALRTGLVTGISGTKGMCGDDSDGRLANAMPLNEYDMDGKLFFSAYTNKLILIGATSGLATPEGIQLGSSLNEVVRAYPTWEGDEEPTNGIGYVPVADSPQAVYRIWVSDGMVTELGLQDINQDCYE